MWCIWKNRNTKVFKNQTRTPLDILRTAEIKGVLWTESHISESTNRASLHIAENPSPIGVNKCYIDGAWKEQDPYTGQGWVYKKDGSTDTMMGAMSIHRSLSSLHAKCEVLICAMKCMKTLQISEVMFAIDCSN